MFHKIAGSQIHTERTLPLSGALRLQVADLIRGTLDGVGVGDRVLMGELKQI